MNRIFGTLDPSKIPFGMLRDYAMEFVNLENFNGTALVDSNLVDRGILREIYTTLSTSEMTSSAYASLPSPNVIDSLWYIARQPGQVVLGGLFYQYSYLDPNAANNGEITVTNGQLFDKYVNGVWQNPYLQGSVVGFAPSTNTYQGQAFNLVLPTNLWLTNSASLVSSIQVDAGDGLGYRTLTPGVNLPVSYADTGMKVLNFKVNLTNSIVLQSHSQLYVVADPLTNIGTYNEFWTPVMNYGFSTTNNNNVYNITSTAGYNGVPGKGIISVQLAKNHNSLTNPLIISEGFDPGIYLTPENPTGHSTLQDFNNSIPSKTALDSLLEGPTAQYDLVYIDFRNGTDDIHRNALVVEDVIRWVNFNKTGTNKIVVLGQSMGGLCARYALKKMENVGETHNVSLFITQGTPHQGAFVPLSLQCMEIHGNSLYVRAGLAKNIYNTIRLFKPAWPNVNGLLTLSNTPAALQMLISHLNGSYQIDNSVHNAWQSELDTVGYPSHGGIRNIAISNGSECGQTQTLGQNQPIIFLDGRLSTSFWGDMLAPLAGPPALTQQPPLALDVIPGRNIISLHFQVNAGEDGGGYLAYNGKITYTKTILYLIPITLTLTNRSYYMPSGVYPYETFAGDYYPLPNIGSSSSKGWFGKYNITLNIAPSFGFGPTASVLDIGKGLTPLAESDYSLPYTEGSPPPAPKNTPFANFITSFTPLSTTNVNNNEAHLLFETRNGNWLAAELSASHPIADCTNLCQVNSISGDLYDCNEVKTYTVPYYSNVTYNWTKSNNLQTIGATNLYYVQVQPLSGSNGQPGSVTVSMTLNNNSNGDCGTQIVTKNINIGVEPLVVNSTVDCTPQSSHYQYLTATATQLPGTTTSNYTWWLTNSTGQVQYQIGNGLVLNKYPIAPSSTIFYQCQAVTPCGTAIYNGYAYNSYYGGYAMTQGVVIYPNPASTTMTVTNNSIPATTDVSGNPNGNVPQSYQVKVYNDKGKILKSAKNEHGSPDVTLSTADMPDGNYFLHIIQGSNTIEKQVMVRH